MTVYEVIEAFARGATSGAASKCKYYPQGRLRIEGNKLYNYDTVIAYWFNGIMLINGTKYSKTTSVHQARLKRQNVKKLVVDEEVLYEIMKNGFMYTETVRAMYAEQEGKYRCVLCEETVGRSEIHETVIGMLCKPCIKELIERGEKLC